MFILERLTSRSSRSLAVMTGFAQAGVARGQADRCGAPDDAWHRFSPRASSLPVIPPSQQVKE